jgi:cyclopropane-fatty-acyl-phospholipid synthase
MRSKLYWGEVSHLRSIPKEHSFSYPIFTFALDLDELPSIAVPPRLFALNKGALFSVREQDYLEETSEAYSDKNPLRFKVHECLRKHGITQSPAKITLLTMPRYFGYVFNPVSFFVCQDASARVVALLTQVNNTFGDTHLYPLVCSSPSEFPCTWNFPKEFFVSPFFAVEGEYSLTLEKLDTEFAIRVDLIKDGSLLFSGRLHGRGDDLTRSRILGTLRRYPITSLLTMPRIHHQALNLYRRANAQVYDRPEPHSTYTFRSHQSLVHRVRLSLLSLFRRGRG